MLLFIVLSAMPMATTNKQINQPTNQPTKLTNELTNYNKLNLVASDAIAGAEL